MAALWRVVECYDDPVIQTILLVALAASHPPKVERPTEVAVTFVAKFNKELGLTAAETRAKLEHMASHPAHFFTAIPALFYQDVRGPFAAQAQTRGTPSPKGLIVGDAHYGNLLSHPGPGGATVWGWADLDKSGTGPIEWDLDRLAAHTVLAGHHVAKADRKRLVDAMFEGYTKELRAFVASGQRPLGYLQLSELEGGLAAFVKHSASESQKAFLDRIAPKGGFSKKKQPTAEEAKSLGEALTDYATRLPKDAPIEQPLKVLALGVDRRSVGGSNAELVKYLALLAPADPKELPIALKLKQVLPSAPDIGTGELAKGDPAKVVERIAVLEGYRSPLLGYAKVMGVGCLVEPMEVQSDTIDPAKLGLDDFTAIARNAGQALARSQLQDSKVTAAQIKEWIGEPATDAEANRRLLEFAIDYAAQTDADTKAIAPR